LCHQILKRASTSMNQQSSTNGIPMYASSRGAAEPMGFGHSFVCSLICHLRDMLGRVTLQFSWYFLPLPSPNRVAGITSSQFRSQSCLWLNRTTLLRSPRYAMTSLVIYSFLKRGHDAAHKIVSPLPLVGTTGCSIGVGAAQQHIHAWSSGRSDMSKTWYLRSTWELECACIPRAFACP
jgi:hypothetical protein